MMGENILITDFPIGSITNQKLRLTELLLMISMAFGIGRNKLTQLVRVLTESKRDFDIEMPSKQTNLMCLRQHRLAEDRMWRVEEYYDYIKNVISENK